MKWMDLLFKEYASPFTLLDGYISTSRLCEFLETFNEQVNERKTWEYYIHKLPAWDERSYDQFKEEVQRKMQKVERPSNEQLETTIKHSFDMMQDFEIEIPQEGG